MPNRLSSMTLHKKTRTRTGMHAMPASLLFEIQGREKTSNTRQMLVSNARQEMSKQHKAGSSEQHKAVSNEHRKVGNSEPQLC